MTKKEHFLKLLDKSKKIVGFTGAGVSTESGIADYRSQGGIWDQFQPVYIDEFLKSEEKRMLYWQRKLAMYPSLAAAKPGPAHQFFANLNTKGKLLGLITQNIDGLHEKSGLPRKSIINLHGTGLEIICLNCSDTQPAEGFMERLNLDNGTPRCQKCRGLLKPNTISFGQSLRSNDLKRAEELVAHADLMIAAGSTLLVHPAASFPILAKERAAQLVILTLSATPLDSYADLVINEPLGDFLQDIS